MFERYSLIGVALSLFIIVIDLYLLRKRRIGGRSFVLWFVIGAGLGLFAGVPPLFSLVWTVFGTEYTVSGIMGAGFLFFLLIFFYLDYRTHRIENQMKKLAMEFSLARYGESRGSPANVEKKTFKKARANASET